MPDPPRTRRPGSPTAQTRRPLSPECSTDGSDRSSFDSRRSSIANSGRLSYSVSGSDRGDSDDEDGSPARRRLYARPERSLSLSPGQTARRSSHPQPHPLSQSSGPQPAVHFAIYAGGEQAGPRHPGARQGLMDVLRSSVRAVSSSARRRTSAANVFSEANGNSGEACDGQPLRGSAGWRQMNESENEKAYLGDQALYDPPQPRRTSYRGRPRKDSYPRSHDADWRATVEMEEGGRQPTRSRGGEGEDMAEAYKLQGGIFSQLLKLSALPPPGFPPAAGLAATATPATPAPAPPPRALPTLKSLGITRSDSIFGRDDDDGELDSEDPRVTGVVPRRHAPGANMPFMKMFAKGGEAVPEEEIRRLEIQQHVSDLLIRQSFILKLAKALMAFGAPSHRIESQLAATALILSIDAQFIHLPSLVIASFGDPDTRTSETHFIKSGANLDLGKLHQVHRIYRAVVHDEMGPEEGTRELHEILHSPRVWKRWERMILAFLSCGLIAPMFFGGSVLDAIASGALGMIMDVLSGVAGGADMYSNVFEITTATVISFVARGLSVTGIFCYGATASAGVCLILPGYAILCGSLELASKNLVSGSVRMVYAIIYSLFLGFGITIGSDLFYIVDPPARRAAEAILTFGAETISGTFASFPSSPPSLLPGLPDAVIPDIAWNGTFTFINATSTQILSADAFTSLTCPRNADWPWWRQAMPEIYLIGLVPLYSFLTGLWLYQPLRSKELPVMVLISSVGFGVCNAAGRWIFNRDDVVSACGAFVIGIMGNVYSRIFKGTAFTSMVPGILFLVPSGISAAGGLAANARDRHQSDAFSAGLLIGARMIQVSIGITVGLFASGMLIYSFGRKKGALFAF